MLDESGCTLGQSYAQVPPFSISGNPSLTRVHWQVPSTQVEPAKMLSQDLQAPAPLSMLPSGHSQVPPAPKDDPVKIVAQSGTQAPAPSSTSSPGHVHVFPSKDDPIKIVAQSGTQESAPPSISPLGQTHASPEPKDEPVKIVAQSGTQAPAPPSI